MPYQDATDDVRSEVIAKLARSRVVPHRDAAWLVLRYGGYEDLRRFCELVDQDRADRDYLLHVCDATLPYLRYGIEVPDARPLLTEVGDLERACAFPWCSEVYELILDRHPDRAPALYWSIFLDETREEHFSTEFLKEHLQAPPDEWQILSAVDAFQTNRMHALHSRGFFRSEDSLVQSTWFRDLVQRGSAASVWILYVTLLEEDPALLATDQLRFANRAFLRSLGMDLSRADEFLPVFRAILSSLPEGSPRNLLGEENSAQIDEEAVDEIVQTLEELLGPGDAEQ